MAVLISLSLSEIYKALCPKCQQKLRGMVKERAGDQLVQQALEDKKTPAKEA